MAITIDDFEKVWASQSPLTPYEFSESNYKEGWNFIGGTPPSRQMWDFLQKQNDEKLKYLLNNFDDYAKKTDLDDYLPLAGGTLTGDVLGVTPPAGDNSKKLATTEFVNAKVGKYLPLTGGTMTGNTLITMGNGESYVRNLGNGLYLGGTNENNASTLVLFTNSNAGGFQLQAGNGTTAKRMVGKPDGTLTWDGKNIERVNASGKNYIRYESGLQICWGDVGTPSNGIFTVTFSSAFVNTSYAMNVTGWPSSTGTGSSRMTSLSGADKTTTSWKGTIVNASNTVQATAVIYIAIGLWK